jgi:hypothetical protein
LGEAWVLSCASALAWEKEKTITRHLEQQLAAAHEIAIPQDDDDRFVDAGSNPDAALTVHLHEQATDLQNRRSMVTIVLEPSSPHYKQWGNLVLLTLRRYALDDHVLSNVTDPSIYWARLNSIMMTWILSTISPKLYEIVREPTEIARQVWLTIEAQFLDNRESRVLQLDAKFRVFKQGDLSVSDYCRRMKGMADNLHALGETIIDRHTILNLLHGLNKRFDHMKIFIKRSQSFPSFHTVRNDLELKEIELDNSAAQGQASPFYSALSGGGRPPQQQLPHAHHSRNRQVPRRHIPLLPPTPTTVAKTRVRTRRRGKARARLRRLWQQQQGQQHPSMTLLLQSLDGHHLDVARDAPSSTACASTTARPACCTGVLWWPQRPFRIHVGASTTPAAGRGLYLVVLDGRVGSAVISQHRQYHGLDSTGGHQLGHRLRHLQPHHLRCR